MVDIDETKIRRLDFALLLVFRELLRQRRTTLVAARLGLTQSAVSHSLARLRDIFGEPLFLRRPDGLQPTQAALALGLRVDALLDLAGDMMGAARRFDPARSDRLFRIATNDFVSTLLAPALQMELARCAPKARFSMRFAMGTPALDALHADLVDVALGRFPTLPHDQRATMLADEEYLVAARAGHDRLRHGLDLATYRDLDHVLVSFNGDFQGTADLALARLGHTRRVVASVPLFLTAFATVSRSDAVTTVPARLARRYADAFGLCLHEPPFPLERFTIVAVRHNRTASDPGLDWLLAMIRRLWLGGPPDGPRAAGN